MVLSVLISTILIVSYQLPTHHGRVSGSEFTPPSDGSSSTSSVSSSDVREHVLYITLL